LLGELVRRVERRAGFSLIVARKIRAYASAAQKAHKTKKQGATGITTVAPYIAGQWGRGDNRLPG